MHKKFIKRDGKTFGPYYYTSYREGDKIKTKYFGKPGEKSRLTSSIPSDAFYKVLLFLAVIVLLFVTFPLIEKILTALPVSLKIQEAPSIYFVSPTPVNESNLTQNYIPVFIQADSSNYKNYSYYLYNSTSDFVSNDKYYKEDRGVSAGYQFTCALLNNGNIDCWGNNDNNQSNDYTQGDAIGVSAEEVHTCALLNNGNITCWGYPDGRTNNYTQGDAIGVSVGGSHTCALLGNGNVNCWGDNTYGKANDYAQGDAIGVSAAYDHTCALLNTGNITCWGDNIEGYTQGDAIGVSAGRLHTCALLNNGNVDCWGDNTNGQANNYTQGDAIGVSAGGYHTCALLNNGNVSCWGLNTSGQAKNYTQGDAIGVSAGYLHTCALLNTGNITCWGDNSYGKANNYTLGNAKKQSFYVFQFLNLGNYYINATSCDVLGNCNSTETRTLTLVPLVPCGSTINESTNLTSDLAGCSADGLIIGANDIVLDCKGHSISGSNNGININGFNGTTIKNCDISLFNYGIYVSNAESINITNNTINSNTFDGIDLNNANNNWITNNTVNSNPQYGIYLSSSSGSNYIINNVINESGIVGLFLDSSGNNNIRNNIIKSDSQSYGLYLSLTSNNNLSEDDISSTAYGIIIDGSADNILSNEVIKSMGTDFSSISGSSGNILTNITFNSSAYPTKASFVYSGDIDVNSSDAVAADPSGLYNISKYISISMTSASAEVLLNISYETVQAGVDENSLKLYKYDGANWILANTTSGLNGVDKISKVVYANITEFSVFAPMGQPDTTTPVITIVNPLNNTILPAGTTSTTVQISTDEIAECRYNLTDSTFSFANGIAFTNTNALNHSFLFSVSDGQNYTLYYKCNDSYGNVNPSSALHNFSIASPSCPDGICNGGETCSTCPADCGTCPSHCTPKTCSELGKECGAWSNGCGGTLNCGPDTISCSQTFGTCSVTGTKTCSNGVYGSCIATDPRPSNCAGKQCGSDGCGGSCGTCPSGQLCNATNKCYTPVCTEDWHCDDWGTCQLIGGNKIRQRYCEDWNTCGTNLSKPATNESCCSDYTPPGSCSQTKPQYCLAGTLIDSCNINGCECPGEEICNETTRKCELPECTDDSDCPTDFECKDNKCVPKALECYSDADCSSDNYCYHGVCKKREVQAAAPSGAGECLPQFNCTEWGNCSIKYTLQDIIEEKLASGKQERSCIDLNKCRPPKVESKSCVERIPIRIEKETFCLDNYINFYDEITGELVSRIKLGIQRLDIELGVIAEKHCPYCEDRIKDYDEVYIDCGGLYCKACNLDNYMNWIAGEELELTLSEGTTVYFTTESGVQHSLTATKITDLLSVDIKSPFSADLNLKETKKFDADADGKYDISVTLVEIKDGKAIVKMNRITALPAPFRYAKIALWIGLALLALIAIREIITVARKISTPSFKKPKIEKERAFPEIRASSRKKRKH